MQTSILRFDKGSVCNWQVKKEKRDALKQSVLNGCCSKDAGDVKEQAP